MQFFDDLKRILGGLRHPNHTNPSRRHQCEEMPAPEHFSFQPATGSDKVTETFRQFGGIVVERKADAPHGWCVGRISVGGENDSRMFAFESSDSFRQATIALTFSCGTAVFGWLED